MSQNNRISYNLSLRKVFQTNTKIAFTEQNVNDGTRKTISKAKYKKIGSRLNSIKIMLNTE